MHTRAVGVGAIAMWGVAVCREHFREQGPHGCELVPAFAQKRFACSGNSRAKCLRAGFAFRKDAALGVLIVEGNAPDTLYAGAVWVVGHWSGLCP